MQMWKVLSCIYLILCHFFFSPSEPSTLSFLLQNLAYSPILFFIKSKLITELHLENEKEDWEIDQTWDSGALRHDGA